MLLLEEFITKTNQSQSCDEVYSHLKNALNSFGFDKIVYSLITDHPSAGLSAMHGIAHDYPDDWMSYYIENDYTNIDPVPKCALKSAMPFTWNEVIKSELSSEELLVMNQAKEAKLLSGVGVPIYGIGGEISGLGLASSNEEFDVPNEMLSQIHMIALQFHHSYLSIKSNQPNFEINLTPREEEILTWCAEGKSDNDISCILGISTHTVRFHMKNIFQKLGVNNKTPAVVKAIRLNLITPSFISALPTSR